MTIPYRQRVVNYVIVANGDGDRAKLLASELARLDPLSSVKLRWPNRDNMPCLGGVSVVGCLPQERTLLRYGYKVMVLERPPEGWSREQVESWLTCHRHGARVILGDVDEDGIAEMARRLSGRF